MRRNEWDLWLEKQIDDIFELAFDKNVCGFKNVNQLATKANLAWATVENLRRFKTKSPQMRIIYKLCKAIKMDVRLLNQDMKKVIKIMR